MGKKIKGRFKLSNKWWNCLTEKERLRCRESYEKIREKSRYGSMKCITNSKISTLSDNQVYSIFRFLASSEWKYHYNYTDEERIKNKFSDRY